MNAEVATEDLEPAWGLVFRLPLDGPYLPPRATVRRGLDAEAAARVLEAESPGAHVWQTAPNGDAHLALARYYDRHDEVAKPVRDVLCVITKRGEFVAGDLRSGLTLYAYPSSPHADEATRLRSDLPAMVVLAERWLRHEYDSEPMHEQTLYRDPEFHARNWVRCGEDPRKWGLPVVKLD